MRSDGDAAEVYANGVSHFEQSPALVRARVSRQARWPFAAAGTVISAALLLSAWHAGQESGGLEDQRLKAEVNRLSQQLSSTQLDLRQQRQRADQFEKQLTAEGRANSLKQQDLLRHQLLKAQAEADQYRQLLQREEDPANQRDRLSALLSEPGVKMMPLQASETAAGSVAYALIIENEKLVFVGSNLPLPGTGKVWQLWLLRSQNPNVVSAGLLRPAEVKSVLLEFDNRAVISDISEIEVTEEPESGSAQPTGAKIFDATQQPKDAPPPSRHSSEGDLLTESLLPSPHLDISR